MQYPLCRHIHATGIQCGSPALTGKIFCFFHNKLHTSHEAFRYAPEFRGYLIPGKYIELTAVEDRESVQHALSIVINSIATGRIGIRRGTALLYGLQLAGSNAHRIGQSAKTCQPNPAAMVRSAQQEPDGLDFADPGALTEDFHEENADKEKAATSGCNPC
jgi:hypothetical protein